MLLRTGRDSRLHEHRVRPQGPSARVGSPRVQHVEQHVFLAAAVSHPWLILHVGRAGVMGEAPVSRGGLLGTQHPAPAPLPSPFCLVPPATSHRVSRDPSGPPPTCHSSLSLLTRGEKGWQEHLPIWRAVLAPVRLHQQRNREHCNTG